MGYVHLGRLQIADESTAGNAVTTATALIPVLSAGWHEENVVDQPEELRGSLAKYFRGDILGKTATVDVEADLTYEDAAYFFQMAIKNATGAADGGSPNAYSYTFTPTLSSPDAPRTKTIQVGDDTSGNQFYSEYTFATSLEISASIQERSRLRTSLVGRQLTAQAFTGSLSNTRSVESAVGQKWVLSLDDTGGTIGTTAYTGLITGFTWRLPQTYEAHKAIDGNLYFNSAKAMPWCPELDLTLEVDTAAMGVRTDFKAGTRQLIRLQNTGSTVHAGTPTATAAKFIRIDGAYRITDWGVVGASANGAVQTVQVRAMGEFDAAASLLFSVVVNNALSALP